MECGGFRANEAVAEVRLAVLQDRTRGREAKGGKARVNEGRDAIALVRAESLSEGGVHLPGPTDKQIARASFAEAY